QGRRLHLLRPPLPGRGAGPRPQRRRDRLQPFGDRRRPQRVPVEARAAGARGRQRLLRGRDQPRRLGEALEDRRVLRPELLLRPAREDHRGGTARQGRGGRGRPQPRHDRGGALGLAVLPRPPARRLRAARAAVSAPARPDPRTQGGGNVYRNFIGGEWVASESTRTTPNLNPADTREVLGQVPLSSADEARRAVAAAKAAYAGWRSTPAPKRGAILFKAMAIMDAERDALARLLTREEGKTVKESLGEIQRTINILEYIAAEGRRLGGQTIPSELPSNFCYTVSQPSVDVVVVTPWT